MRSGDWALLAALATQALQALTWLTRRWTSSIVSAGTPPESLALFRATTACQAPGRTAAGFFMRASTSLALFPGWVSSAVGPLLHGCRHPWRPFPRKECDEMADSDSLALEFESYRAHLRGVAYRVLGSFSDADDAVQEAWVRLSRTDVSDVVNLRAWLTTVTSRVALNMLESRGARREDVHADVAEPAGTAGLLGGGASGPLGPEDEALLGDEVSSALQVVLDELEPRERLAFVLHDLFAVPFD